MCIYKLGAVDITAIAVNCGGRGARRLAIRPLQVVYTAIVNFSPHFAQDA